MFWSRNWSQILLRTSVGPGIFCSIWTKGSRENCLWKLYEGIERPIIERDDKGIFFPVRIGWNYLYRMSILSMNTEHWSQYLYYIYLKLHPRERICYRKHFLLVFLFLEKWVGHHHRQVDAAFISASVEYSK